MTSGRLAATKYCEHQQLVNAKAVDAGSRGRDDLTPMNVRKTLRTVVVPKRLPLQALSLSLLASSCAVGTAHADDLPTEVAIIPVLNESADLGAMLELARDLERELDSQGVRHLSLQDARSLFEQRHSREPTPPVGDFDVQIDGQFTRALDAVSSGAPLVAQAELRSALARGKNELESLNRSPRPANQLFHACILAVQVLAESGNESAAKNQARDCLLQSPGITLPPENRTYHPRVRSLLADAQAALAQEPSASVTIESTPPGCPVYVQGKRVGVSPHVERAPLGSRLLVQVECGEVGRPGRVHTLMLGARTATLHVDGALEAVVRTTNGVLALAYSDTQQTGLRDHLRSIQRVLGVPATILLSRPQSDRVALHRVGAGAGAAVQISSPVRQQELRAAVTSLLAPVREPQTHARKAIPKSLSSEWPARRPSVLTKTLGLSAIAAGLGVTGLSFWRYTTLRDRGDKYAATDPADDPYYARGTAWSDARTTPYVLGGIGSGLSLSGSLWLSIAAKSDALPWWTAALAGSIGAGLASWGATEIAQGSTCGHERSIDTRSCVDERNRRDFGALLMLAAAPALGVFVTKVARTASHDRSTTVHVGARGRGAMVTIGRAL